MPAEGPSRPVPRGKNPRGLPTWNGVELATWRRSRGVQQNHVAKKLATFASALSVLYENKRAPVALPPNKVERYLSAIDELVLERERDMESATRELIALREAEGYAP